MGNITGLLVVSLFFSIYIFIIGIIFRKSTIDSGVLFGYNSMLITLRDASIVGISVFTILYSFSLLNIQGHIVLFVLLFIISSYRSILSPFLLSRKNVNINPDLNRWVYSKTGIRVNVIVSSHKFVSALTMGVFPFSRIVIIGANLIDKLNRHELEGILLHEIGHLRNNHLTILFASNLCLSAVNALVILKLLTNGTPFLMYMAIAIITWLTLYLLPTPMHRYFEYQADKFVLNYINKEEYSKTLMRLDDITLNGLSVNDIHHPSLHNRIQNILK